MIISGKTYFFINKKQHEHNNKKASHLLQDTFIKPIATDNISFCSSFTALKPQVYYGRIPRKIPGDRSPYIYSDPTAIIDKAGNLSIHKTVMEKNYGRVEYLIKMFKYMEKSSVFDNDFFKKMLETENNKGLVVMDFLLADKQFDIINQFVEVLKDKDPDIVVKFITRKSNKLNEPLLKDFTLLHHSIANNKETLGNNIIEVLSNKKEPLVEMLTSSVPFEGLPIHMAIEKGMTNLAVSMIDSLKNNKEKVIEMLISTPYYLDTSLETAIKYSYKNSENKNSGILINKILEVLSKNINNEEVQKSLLKTKEMLNKNPNYWNKIDKKIRSKFEKLV